ncbi:MAG TPA: MFS transporter [Chloroflexota bacterium]|nr:MFS transporter [Chloroflexota bacterium]
MTGSRGESPQFLLLVAVFVGALDQTVVAALLPAVVRDLSVPFDRLDQAAWAVTLYLAAYAAVVPFAGRLIDAGAHSVVLLSGLGVFAAGSILCARADTLELLVAGRVVQALGAGVLLPVALHRAGHGDPYRRLVRVGVVAAVAEAGAVCGPIYGAGALALLDWRWAFWFNLPVVAFVALAVVAASTDRLRLPRVPWSALFPPVAVGLALGVAVAGISREVARTAAWLPPACAVAASALLLWVVRIEYRRRPPSALARLGRLAGFWVLLGLHLLLGVALVTPLVLVPVWASTLLALDPPGAAQVLLWLTLAIPPTALLGAAAAARVGRRATAALGFGLVAAGLYGMGGWPATSTLPEMTPSLIIAGLGFGLVIAPLTDLVFGFADLPAVGSAIGLATAARVVGMAIGLAALTRWGINQLTARLADLPPPSFTGGIAAFGALAEYQRAVSAIGADIFGALFRAGAICAALAAIGLLAVREPVAVND